MVCVQADNQKRKTWCCLIISFEHMSTLVCVTDCSFKSKIVQRSSWFSFFGSATSTLLHNFYPWVDWLWLITGSRRWMTHCSPQLAIHFALTSYLVHSGCKQVPIGLISFMDYDTIYGAVPPFQEVGTWKVGTLRTNTWPKINIEYHLMYM